SEVDEALQRAAAQRPAHVDVPPGPPEQPKGGVVPLQGLTIPAAYQQHVTDRSKTLRPAPIVREPGGQPGGRVGQTLGLAQIGACDANDAFVETLDDSGIPE